MQINRHSIFLKLNLLFLIAIFSISIVFFIFLRIGEKRQMGIIMNDSRQVMRMIRTANRDMTFSLKEMLAEEGYQLIKDKKRILTQAVIVDVSKYAPPRSIRKPLLLKRLQVLKLDSDIYFLINPLRYHGTLLIKNRSYPNISIWIISSYIMIVSILFLIFLALKRALKPIQKLENEIKRFGNGVLDINTKSDKKDEIAAVGNQFYNAVQKINALQNTRTLFLRNMMHELKTPITKGKLSLSLMAKNSESEMLEKVFHTLEALINEMADIERISTQNIVIEKKEHRLSDIIDHAQDLLYLEESAIVKKNINQHLHCDFKLFSIAVKNLIDNGVKYSQNHQVVIEANGQSVAFINSAPPLAEDFSYYLEPFYKGALTQRNQNGFGLGLYIVNEIVKIHRFTLDYRHCNGENIFTIEFSP